MTSYRRDEPAAILFGQPIKLELDADSMGDYDYTAKFTDERLKDLPAIPITSNMRKLPSKPKPLPPEMKARWLVALRSGNYSQAKAYLTQLDADEVASHCCLGVLAELEDVPFNKGHDCDDAIRIYLFESGSSSTWLGGKYLDLLPETLQHALGEFNDSGEWSFSKIAQLVEVIL